MRRRYDVCIIGGGASGLAAASSISGGASLCILEKNRSLGRKLAATGGGRCNLTNISCRRSGETLGFFSSMGLETYADSEGRCYPYSNCASDVVRVLSDSLREKDADVVTGFTVTGVERRGGLFCVKGKEGGLRCEKLVIASGGKAAPQFGTTGDGYGFARSLGHKVTRTYPILTGIECRGFRYGDISSLKGVRARGRLELLKDGEGQACSEGEIQFTGDGISGICVFDLTPFIRTDRGGDLREELRRFEVRADLASGFTGEEIEARRRAGHTSFGILGERLAEMISLEDIKDVRIPVSGVKGWRNAQCTAGGVDISEVDMDTMESRIVKGLYFTGEILDIQGPCGGYNLQNAWETGIRAAGSINSEIQD